MGKFKLKKGTDFVLALVAIIASLAVGGFFVSGGFLNVVILKWLPLIVHQVVGWVMIASTLIAALMKLLK